MLFHNVSSVYTCHEGRLILVNCICLILIFLSKQKCDIELNIPSVQKELFLLRKRHVETSMKLFQLL